MTTAPRDVDCFRVSGECIVAGVAEHLINGLSYYVAEHIEPGSFLRAVLENDLLDAVARADTYTLGCLPGVVEFLTRFAPPDCYGSSERVAAWLKKDHKEK